MSRLPRKDEIRLYLKRIVYFINLFPEALDRGLGFFFLLIKVIFFLFAYVPCAIGAEVANYYLIYPTRSFLKKSVKKFTKKQRRTGEEVKN
jgi:hypothetical protein